MSSQRTRRVPTQERSRALVERILDAATGLFATRRYDDISTNRIADAAGVSPGSLYQYFPNKEAVVAAVHERYAQALADRFTEEIRRQLDAAPEEMIRTVFAAFVDTLAADPALLRTFVERVPNPFGVDGFQPIKHRLVDTARLYLHTQGSTLRGIGVDASVWILVEMGLQLSIRFVLDAPPLSREDFVDTMTGLVLARMTPPEPAESGRAATDPRPRGRPAPPPEDVAAKLRAVAAARERGVSAAEAARAVGWSRSTLYRHTGRPD